MGSVYAALGAVDGWIAHILPLAIRLLVWGALAGALSLLLYAWLSPQAKLSNFKTRLRELRGELTNSELEFAEFLKLSKENMRTALVYLALVLGPALVSVLPVLLLASWLHAAVQEQVALPLLSAQVAWEWLFFTSLAIVAVAGRLIFSIH